MVLFLGLVNSFRGGSEEGGEEEGEEGGEGGGEEGGEDALEGEVGSGERGLIVSGSLLLSFVSSLLVPFDKVLVGGGEG
jgi:hypothetical protein